VQPKLQPVVTQQEILDVEKIVRAVPVADHVIDSAVELASATRATEPGASELAKKYIEWGAGPRASQYLVIGAKALALMTGLSAPETKHVRSVAPFVLSHRIVPNYRATGEGLKSAELVAKLIEGVHEPSY